MKQKLNINTLVDLVVNTALSDTTSPDPKNPRQDWLTDELLNVAVDQLMVRRLNDPAGLAKIGRLVQVEVSGLPEMEALARITVIRGERRGPVSAKRKGRVSALIAEAEAKIGSLPASPRKQRLASFLAFNHGVFCDAYEMFTEAADRQRRSAEIAQANGDKPGEVIGLFLEQVYLLQQAMVDSNQAATDAAFTAQEARLMPLVDGVRGTPLEVSWGQGNSSCHMFQACYIWLGQDHPDLDKWVVTEISAARSLKGVEEGSIAKHHSVINSFRKGNQQAKAELEKTAAESGDVTRRAEALLVLARSAIAAGDKKSAGDLVRRMPKKGASHIRAVAQRMLGA